MFGDTLVGFVEGQYQELPLAELQSVRARQVDKLRTALLVGGVIVAGGVAMAALQDGGESDPNIQMEDDIVLPIDPTLSLAAADRRRGHARISLNALLALLIRDR